MSDPYSRIFLLSHMRAFTSLVGHILGSHPQISGYYEMHISYDHAQSLQKQLDLYLEHDSLKPDTRYLFDKLLHNDYALQLERLNVSDTKILIALRQPEPTIKSIVNLFAHKAVDDPYASPEMATRYYIDRLYRLAEYSRQHNHSYYYFDAEMLQVAADVLLPRLSIWLELDSPLSDHYAVFSQTGQERKGDTSNNIQSGKIIKTSSDYSVVHIPEELLQMAQQAYRDCRRQLIDKAADSITIR